MLVSELERFVLPQRFRKASQRRTVISVRSIGVSNGRDGRSSDRLAVRQLILASTADRRGSERQKACRATTAGQRCLLVHRQTNADTQSKTCGSFSALLEAPRPGITTGSLLPPAQNFPAAYPILLEDSERHAEVISSLPDVQAQDASFVDYFSGNKVLPGSAAAAHCYAGHQFGHFSGQLGDGAAIYLGEV